MKNVAVGLIAFVVVALMVLVITPILFWYYAHSNPTANFSCEGAYTGWDETSKQKIELHSSLRFFGKKGENLFDGKIRTPSGEWQIVRFIEQFNLDYYNGTYYITSTSTQELPGNEVNKVSLGVFALPATTKTGSTDAIELFRQGKNGYLLTSGRIPFFYCKE